MHEIKFILNTSFEVLKLVAELKASIITTHLYHFVTHSDN